jgi:hypothetical protein
MVTLSRTIRFLPVFVGLLSVLTLPAQSYEVSMTKPPLGRLLGGNLYLCSMQDATLTTMRSFGRWIRLAPESTNPGIAHASAPPDDGYSLPYQRELHVQAGENSGNLPLYATISIRATDTRNDPPSDLGIIGDPMGSFNVILLPDENDACIAGNPRQFFMRQGKGGPLKPFPPRPNWVPE